MLQISNKYINIDQNHTGSTANRFTFDKKDFNPRLAEILHPFKGKSPNYILNTVFQDAQLGLKNELVSMALLFARGRASQALEGAKVDLSFSQDDVTKSKMKLQWTSPMVRQGLKANLEDNLKALNAAFKDIKAKLPSKGETLGAVLIAEEQAKRFLIIETLKNLPDANQN